jgi:hypothetical protein
MSVSYASPSDNFNDNSMDTSLWSIYQESPTIVWLNETNQRLELRSTGVHNDAGADYCANAWGFSPTKDFSFKIDFKHDQSPPLNPDDRDWDFSVHLGLAKDWDNHVFLESGYGVAGPSSAHSFFYCATIVNGYEDSKGEMDKVIDYGTLYISYDADKDELYLSNTGYWDTNAWITIPDLLQGEWDASLVFPYIGGWSDGVTLNSGNAYLDNFVVDNGEDGPETGNMVTSNLWIKAVINSEEKGPIEAVWQKGGEDTTSRGDRVIWGHFYANPSDVTWGSENNPDLFVKIWFDVSGRVDVNYFHVSVPDIVVYSDYPYDGIPDEQGTTTMSRRYIRQYYEGGQSYSEENYEDGNPPSGYSPAGNSSGYYTINDLRIGSIINTVEKGPIDAVWRFGGQDTTARGDQVVWGHFYANPSDVTWGSQDNPDLFVKIWFDVSGRVDVNFFHVSVPDIEVYSDLPDDGVYDQKGTTIMDNRYIRHEYWR